MGDEALAHVGVAGGLPRRGAVSAGYVRALWARRRLRTRRHGGLRARLRRTGLDCLLARLQRTSLGYLLARLQRTSLDCLLARLQRTSLGYLLGRSCWCSRSDCWLR